MVEKYNIYLFDVDGHLVNTWVRDDSQSAFVVFRYLIEEYPDCAVCLSRNFS